MAACCGSSLWVRKMLSQRPFKDTNEVYASAERFWRELPPNEWLEAFRAHPRIGEKKPESSKGERAEGWSAKEQASMDSAGDTVRTDLARANAEYEKKFGWIYIVCATGKSPEEMLALCRTRLRNTPDEELKIAAEAQLKITRLRLDKLLTL